MVTIWMIGFLFTLGLMHKKATGKVDFFFSALILIVIWPYMLGTMVDEVLDLYFDTICYSSSESEDDEDE